MAYECSVGCRRTEHNRLYRFPPAPSSLAHATRPSCARARAHTHLHCLPSLCSRMCFYRWLGLQVSQSAHHYHLACNTTVPRALAQLGFDWNNTPIPSCICLHSGTSSRRWQPLVFTAHKSHWLQNKKKKNGQVLRKIAVQRLISRSLCARDVLPLENLLWALLLSRRRCAAHRVQREVAHCTSVFRSLESWAIPQYLFIKDIVALVTLMYPLLFEYIAISTSHCVNYNRFLLHCGFTPVLCPRAGSDKL